MASPAGAREAGRIAVAEAQAQLLERAASVEERRRLLDEQYRRVDAAQPAGMPELPRQQLSGHWPFAAAASGHQAGVTSRTVRRASDEDIVGAGDAAAGVTAHARGKAGQSDLRYGRAADFATLRSDLSHLEFFFRRCYACRLVFSGPRGPSFVP